MTDPVLGDLYPDETRCLRMRPWGLCHRPGAWHIIWSGSRASVACSECVGFAREQRRYENVHVLGPACGLIGSMYYEDEKACRMPEGPEDIRRGRVVF